MYRVRVGDAAECVWCGYPFDRGDLGWVTDDVGPVSCSRGCAEQYRRQEDVPRDKLYRTAAEDERRGTE
jgi:hypothetical protein